jgi:hypothetical protein
MAIKLRKSSMSLSVFRVKSNQRAPVFPLYQLYHFLVNHLHSEGCPYDASINALLGVATFIGLAKEEVPIIRLFRSNCALSADALFVADGAGESSRTPNGHSARSSLSEALLKDRDGGTNRSLRHIYAAVECCEHAHIGSESQSVRARAPVHQVMYRNSKGRFRGLGQAVWVYALFPAEVPAFMSPLF